MSQAEEDSIEVEQWCVGYRYVDTRRLNDSEIAVIRATAGRSAWTLAWLAPAPLVVALLLVLGGAWLPTVAPVWINWLWLLCMVVAPILGLPVWILSARNSWRSCFGLNRDARLGDAWVFESPQATDADGAVPPLAVLPVSLHAFVPGTLMLSDSPLSISEVAKGPSYAMRVPIATTHDEENAHRGGDFMRRTLNGSEQGEIAIAIRHLRWPGKRMLLLPVLLAWAIFSLRNGLTTYSSATVTGLMLTVLCGMGVARYFRGFALTMKMRRDLQTGWAITAPPKDSRAQEGPFVEEFLPHSKLLWTVNGTPAAWRDLRRTPLVLQR